MEAPDAGARRERDRGLRKVRAGTRWLALGSAVGVGAVAGALAAPHLVQRVDDQVDTSSSSATDGATPTPSDGSAGGGAPVDPSSPYSIPSTPSTSGRLTPPAESPQAPSGSRRRSHAVTGAS